MSMLSRLCFQALFCGLVATHGAPALAEDDYDVIRSSCKADLRLSDSGCDCVVARAKSELSDAQRAFLVASVKKDPTMIAAAQGQLTGDEMMAMMNFMTRTPRQCQSQ